MKMRGVRARTPEGASERQNLWSRFRKDINRREKNGKDSRADEKYKAMAEG